MKTEVKFNVLDVIEEIYLHSRDSHLREPLFELLKDQLAMLSEYLQLTDLQSVLFANCFILGYDDASVAAVFRHFGFEEYKVLRYKMNIQTLFDRKLLKKGRRYDEKKMDFTIENFVINSITKNLCLPIEKNTECQLVDLLEEFDANSDLYDDDKISVYEFTDMTNEMIDDHQCFPFFQQIRKWKLDDFEIFFLLDTVWDAVQEGDNNFNTVVQRTVNDFYKKKSTAMATLTYLLEGKTRLTKLDLIEFNKVQFRNSCNAKLSKKMVSFLKDKEKIDFDFSDHENTKLVQHKNIAQKTLYYNEAEITQIGILKIAIDEKKFISLEARLKEKAMPCGITALLHGDPGTGKTESVYQLAKESGRNIFKVDISETKSMWFGESQKLVKKIFTDYEEYRKTEKVCPILLFNEADAVIGKRKPAGSSNTAETENAIQNILLEELEKFEGILFATTNLLSNLDSAFERRFLFKVRFEKPALENAAKIWKSKLPFLSENESLQLAERFDFSGGEIENIARKCAMNELLNGIKPDFYKIEKFCKEEKWSSEDKKKIGFRISVSKS